jgi:hypothetical protein
LQIIFKAEIGDVALDVPMEDQQNQQFWHLLQSLPFLTPGLAQSVHLKSACQSFAIFANANNY